MKQYTVYHYNKSINLPFFGKYPAMDIHLLLRLSFCHFPCFRVVPLSVTLCLIQINVCTPCLKKRPTSVNDRVLDQSVVIFSL